MSAFNLEKALAGDKVVTRDGREITQLVKFKTNTGDILYGLDVENDHIEQWLVDGRYHDVKDECGGDLIMSPRRVSGFVNIYDNITPTWHETELQANSDAVNIIRDQSIHKEKTVVILATIDLSDFEEGHGLNKLDKQA